MTRRTSALVATFAILPMLRFGVAGAQEVAPTTTEATTTTTVPTTQAPTTLPPVTAPPVIPTAPPVTPDADSTTSSSTSTTLPPSVSEAAAQAYVDSLRARSGSNSSAALLDALKALETLGFSHDEAVKVGFGHFPVGGLASFTDDFGDFRAGPPVHPHQGTDIFANFNTPIRAPFDGVVRLVEEGGLGGKSVYVTAPDGTYYYGTHLNGFPTDVTSGSTVTQGQTVGLVGDTGNARGTSPHLHFEIHPGGGAAVNPKPLLDAWLAEALAAVPKLVGATVVDQPAIIQSTGLTRRFDLSNVDQRVQAPVEPLLWASSVNPAGSALRLAQAEVARMAEGIDWDRQPVGPPDVASSQRPPTPPNLPGVAGGG